MKPRFSKWTVSNFKVVKTLAMPVQAVFTEFLLQAAQAGVYGRIDVREGGRRTPQIQKEIYDRGDSWVLCPYSKHCQGLAIDFIVLTRLGALVYEYAPWEKFWRKSMDKQYDKLRKIALRLGIENGRVIWGVDDAHFHYVGEASDEEIARGLLPTPPTFTPAPKDKVTVRAMKRLGLFDIV